MIEKFIMVDSPSFWLFEIVVPSRTMQYTKQRNKVKQIVRNDLKEEQNIIAQQYKSNPKKILEVCQFKN